MLIRAALCLFLMSLPFFLLAFTLKLAIFLLLSAFALLLVAIFVVITKQIVESLTIYFSTSQREKRYSLFVQNKKNRIARLFYFKQLQLDYFKEFQRKKILDKNNRIHIHALSKAIELELQKIQSKISITLFVSLQLENHRYRTQKNEQALLELHKKISSLAGK